MRGRKQTGKMAGGRQGKWKKDRVVAWGGEGVVLEYETAK